MSAGMVTPVRMYKQFVWKSSYFLQLFHSHPFISDKRTSIFYRRPLTTHLDILECCKIGGWFLDFEWLNILEPQSHQRIWINSVPIKKITHIYKRFSPYMQNMFTWLSDDLFFFFLLLLFLYLILHNSGHMYNDA